MLRVASGPGGVALRVHGPSWSLVFRVSPVVDVIVLCLDATSRYGWRIEDDAESRELIEEAVSQVVAEAARYGWGGTSTRGRLLRSPDGRPAVRGWCDSRAAGRWV
ncbi:hypothetical protein GCM10010429_47680 [Micromonospora olivasterospora]|uniref:Uncharacterized protein n=1 Tax=Micromonospora olivasterospora TaxID=1880 RepID=A0A562I4K6_MICOL|nr:hypothetical protein JD77_00892 [Micromonospora olivasterospora]